MKNSKEIYLDLFLYSLGEVAKFLIDDDVTDIMLNQDGSIWLDTASQGKCKIPGHYSSRCIENIIRVIAGISQTTINFNQPYLSVELPYNKARFQAVIPPISAKPTFVIRKYSQKHLSLADLIDIGTINSQHFKKIKQAINCRKNILIAGSTNSGKTTLCNAIIDSIPDNERIVIIEDVREIHSENENIIYLSPNNDNKIKDLIKLSLRMNIDRIVLGEIRDGAAFDLITAWNTGHPGGVATIHSNSAQDAIARVNELAFNYGKLQQELDISKYIDIIIYITRKDKQRIITEIIDTKEI